MIEVGEFDKIRYGAHRGGQKPAIPNLIGLDTEAFTDGKPFLCMLSTGLELDLEQIPRCFFAEVPSRKMTKEEKFLLSCSSTYLDKHYCTYNLKYDSGAVLWHLPDDVKHDLWKYGEVRYMKEFTIEYIPHKFLAFGYRGFHVRIWDVAQYFKMPLQQACETYLGRKGKLELETKSFTPAYVKKHLKRLKEYCHKDAIACADVGNYFIGKLKEFGIRTTSLYSPASLSYEYFSSRCHIVTVKRLWDRYRTVVKYAVAAYKGGKFECTARGVFPYAWQYDIVSAYPFYIQNLLNIERARIVYSKEFIADAQYAFLHVRIRNEGKHIPCAIKNNQGIDIYPSGEFYNVITLHEYLYLQEIGVECEILSGCWLVMGVLTYPYKAAIADLFALKKKYKGKDLMLTNVSKLMMNSFYGKTLQMIKEYVKDDKGGESVVYAAGTPFNPVHGAIVTANTRIQITRVQNLLKEKCLAVHTDSALCLEPLPPELTKGRLGELELQKEGAGVVVACGQYQVGLKGAYKGFRPTEEDNWMGLLAAHRRDRKFKMPCLHVEGWCECMAKGRNHYRKVNVFQQSQKEVDLNADSKRLWPTVATGESLLAGLEQSMPQVVIQTEPESLKT